MRLTATRRAVGLRLARDVSPATSGAAPLLRCGAVVSPRFAENLGERGIHAVWVEDEFSEGIVPEDVLPEEIREETADRVADALDGAREALAEGQRLPRETVEELADVAARLSAAVSGSPSAALALNDLAAADTYTHRHSIDVTALGLLIARVQFSRNGWEDYLGRRRWDGIDAQLTTLGLGLLLHDVGKLAVPASIVNKPGPLDEDEWALMRQHPLLGAEMLPDTMSPRVLAVVRWHHERWDGSGYPRGLVGPDTDPFARIAAVADVYDAVTSARPYKEARPPHVGVRIVEEGDGTLFDPEVVATFRRLVFPYPVGTEVELPDGRAGVVTVVDPDRPWSPRVRVPEPDGPVEVEVDLAEPAVVV